MSDTPETKPKGWHPPANPGEWRTLAKPSRKRRLYRGVPTMPRGLSTEPKQAGGWHWPSRAETIARPAPEMASPESFAAGLGMSPFSEPDAVAPPPEDVVPVAPAAPRPEDLTIGTAVSNEPIAPRPEDVIPPSPSVPRPEDMALADDEDDDIGDELEDSIDDLDMSLAELDDEEDAFSMSELMALDALSQGSDTTTAAPTLDDDGVSVDDLSPAERAAMGVSQTSGFDYASKLAELEGGDDLSYTAPQPQSPAAEGGFDYSSKLAELEGTGDATQSLGATPVYEQPLDPEEAAFIERFGYVEQQMPQLRRQFEMGMLNRQDYDNALRELMILDPNDDQYWMIGDDTEIWYKYDPIQQTWVVKEPPHRKRPPTVQQSAVPTDTGNLDPNQVSQMAGLPNVGGSDPYSYTQPGTGAMDLGNTYQAPEPVPVHDPQQTVVGDAAYRDVLPGSEPTVQNMGAVGVDDGGYIPAAQAADAGAPAYDQMVDEDITDEIERAKQRQQRRLIGTLATVFGVIVGITFLLVAGVIFYLFSQYNGIVADYDTAIGGFGSFETDFQTVVILDVNGDEIARLRSEFGGDRTNVNLENVSPNMVHAIVSTENERFFVDPGFDMQAIFRAFLTNITQGEVVSGGSTITQQLARNIILRDAGREFATSAERKLHEIIVARELALRYSKEQLLEVYLNEVYFGNQKYGIEAASEFYFDKPSAELNIGESALLAGLVQAPAANDPVTNPQAAFDRIDEVTRLMVEAGGGTGCLPIPFQSAPLCITESTLEGPASIEIAQVKIDRYLPEETSIEYPHFVRFVQEQIQSQYTQEEMFRRGFTIRTTLNPRLQDAAETALIQQLAGIGTSGVNTGTVMVTDPTSGAIRAMVGSPDFNNEAIDGQVNLALSWQQPGSAIKPVVYAAALSGIQTEAGANWYTPATILWDVPTAYSDGTAIRNYDGQFRGPVSVRRALQNSFNVPAVKAYNFIGDANFQNTSVAMGLRYLPDAVFGPPTGVGATDVRLYDMMEAYGTMANNGTLSPLYAIEEITDVAGNVVEFERAAPSAGITPQVAFLMQNILSDNQARTEAFPPNNTLSFPSYPGAVAAKTGTSSGGVDLWTMGFTKNAVVGVWVGRVDNQETFGTSGYLTASPIWNRVMSEVLQVTAAPTAFTPPQDGSVVLREVCSTTGALADPTGTVPCVGEVRQEYVLTNQPPPPATEGFVQQVNINTWTGLIANDFCSNDTITQTVINIDDPTAIQWLQSSAGAAFASQLGFANGIPVAPTGACDINVSLPQVAITNPAQGATVTTAIVPIEGTLGMLTNFASYNIQVASQAQPDTFQIVSENITTPPVGTRLGEWDATNFQNGTYIIRLSVNSTNGGYLHRTATINLAKPLPTPTPTPLPIPTSPAIGVPGGGAVEPTPIPFDNNGSIGAQSINATPTLDFTG